MLSLQMATNMVHSTGCSCVHQKRRLAPAKAAVLPASRLLQLHTPCQQTGLPWEACITPEAACLQVPGGHI